MGFWRLEEYKRNEKGCSTRFNDDRLNNSTGADAASADFHGLVAVLGRDSNFFQIRQPAPFGFIMSVTDIISGGRFLAAYFTHFRHDKLLYMNQFKNQSIYFF